MSTLFLIPLPKYLNIHVLKNHFHRQIDYNTSEGNVSKYNILKDKHVLVSQKFS